jgi:pentatricopeptide repeat protein
MSIAFRLFSAYQYGKSLIKIGKNPIRFYTTNIATHHSFLYDPPKNGQDSSDSLKRSAPKEVLPLLQAIYQNNTKETWRLYLELCDKKQLYLLSPLQHSKVLKTFSFKKFFNEKQRHNLETQLLFIFNRMKGVGIEPDVNDFTHMMNVFSLSGNSKICDKLWEEMARRKIQPNIYTYNSYITSCWGLIKSSKQKEEGFRKAQRILIELNNSGRKPSLVTNCFLIRLFSASKRLGNAQGLLETTFSQENLSKEITRKEILRNRSMVTQTFNYLMNAHGNAGDLLMMDKCFQIFLKTELPPHIYMFNTFVRNSSRIDINKAKGYIKKMIQEFDLEPTHQIFSYILFNLYEKGLTRKAVEFLKVMQDEFDFPPSKLMLVKIYMSMLRKNRHDDAKEFAARWKIPINL